MTATVDDPAAPVIFRTSGEPPFPSPLSPLPPDIAPRQVMLRDRITTATLVPFSAPEQVPLSLMSYLCDQLNREIEKGDTYPMTNPIPLENFGGYWFANFGAVMILGDVSSADELQSMARTGCDWDKACLGSFYIKPNYPGRSSHVCNGGFLVTDGARNRGVGRLMGEGYLEWAPKLGYTYSVFNLVYETNVASCRIWDALGFKRIGRVKGCGSLRSYPDQLVDGIIYGRDLGPDGDDYATEERFDKIRYYLKHGKYPNGSDRAEKSRLRSAATHYKLIPAMDEEPEKLMLKGKEVISDPQRQYEIARTVHAQSHGGINKSTATIAEKYHWIRIKETVSMVIKNCTECKDMAKQSSTTRTGENTNGRKTNGNGNMSSQTSDPSSAEAPSSSTTATQPHSTPQSPQFPSIPKADPSVPPHADVNGLQTEAQQPPPLSLDGIQGFSSFDLPVDPRIMDSLTPHFPDYSQATHQGLQQYPQQPPTHPIHNQQAFHHPQHQHHSHHQHAQAHSQANLHLGHQQPQLQTHQSSHQLSPDHETTKFLMQQQFATGHTHPNLAPSAPPSMKPNFTSNNPHVSPDVTSNPVAMQQAMLTNLQNQGSQNHAQHHANVAAAQVALANNGGNDMTAANMGAGSMTGPTGMDVDQDNELTQQLMAGFGDASGFGSAG